MEHKHHTTKKKKSYMKETFINHKLNYIYITDETGPVTLGGHHK